MRYGEKDDLSMNISFKRMRLKRWMIFFATMMFVLSFLGISEKSYAHSRDIENNVNYVDIHMTQFSHLEDDLFKTPKNFDERMAKLSFRIVSVATHDIFNKDLQLELFDKRNQTIQHTTLYISVLKNDQVLFQNVFHTHSGLLTIMISPNKSIKNWEVVADREKLWLKSENDKFNVKTPTLEKGQYDVQIAVIGVDDDKTMFPSNAEPKFTSSFTVNENGVILDSNSVLESKNTKLNTSPLKQLKSGIPLKDVKCNQGFELIFKSNGGKPVCVKPETKQILIERGWTKPI